TLLSLPITTPGDAHYRPLVILDEVHKAIQGQTAKLLKEHFIGKVMVGGFTATDVAASKNLFDTQEPVYRLPLKQAITDEILCQKVETGLIPVRIDDAALLERMHNVKENA